VLYRSSATEVLYKTSHCYTNAVPYGTEVI